MTSFQYYQHLKKSGVKTLIAGGANVREAFSIIRKEMPYLFFGKKRLDEIDQANRDFDNFLDQCEKSHP
jgi:hypothetical protein